MNKQNRLQYSTKVVDVAIVGAGIAGCYAAYRLRSVGPVRFDPWGNNDTARRALQVSLIEASDEVGGRMKSRPLCGYNADFGAMRFNLGSDLLFDLIDHLELRGCIDRFEREKAENLFFTRGHSFRRGQIGAARLPYALREEEKGRLPSNLVRMTIDRAIPGFSRLKSLHDRSQAAGRTNRTRSIIECYRELVGSAQIDGRPLGHLSWREFLCHFLSHEAIQFIEDFEGYEIRESNGSALHWMDNEFFAPSDSRQVRLDTGAAKIPQTLARRFSDLGGYIHLGTRLESIRRDQNGYVLKVVNSDGRQIIRAEALIMATSRSALAQIDMPFLDLPGFAFDNSQVRSVDAFKLFLVYPHAWWQRMGIAEGFSTTDLPLRQVYYYPPGQEGALLLASYCCGPDIGYWDRLTLPQPTDNAERTVEAKVARDRIMKRAHSLLATMHQDVPIPEPLEAYIEFWRGRDGCEGWHVWQPDSEPTGTINQATRPNLAEAIFLVGEAWSMEPGSVNGALLSVERLLQGKMRISAPKWSAAYDIRDIQDWEEQ